MMITRAIRYIVSKVQKTPKLSIIVPFFNNIDHIERCITSIAQQTYKDFEVILVDDGSSDNSAKLARAVCRANRLQWNLLTIQRNSGVAAARNIGLKHARGDFIRFIDSDDFIDVDSIEDLMRYSAEQDLIRGGITTYNSDNKKIDIVTDEVISRSNPTALPTSCQLKLLYGFTAMIFRRELLVKNGLKFDEKLQNTEDTHFLVDVFLAKPRVTLIPQLVYNYCRRPKSLSNPSAPNLIYFLNIAARLKYMLTRFEDTNLRETAVAAFQNTYKYYLEPDIIPLAEAILDISELETFRSAIEGLRVEIGNIASTSHPGEATNQYTFNTSTDATVREGRHFSETYFDQDRTGNLIALMQRTRTHWETEDWRKLAEMDPIEVMSHPKHADLLLLKATALIQLGDYAAGRQFLKEASALGVDRHLIAQVLIAGTHNNLGRAALILNDEHRSASHYESSVNVLRSDIQKIPYVEKSCQTRKKQLRVRS